MIHMPSLPIKSLKHQVRKSIRAAESEFIKDQIQNNPRNTNCIWKAIRLCIPKRSVSPKVYSKEDKIVADTFNIFFASVGKSTNSKIESLAEENNFNLNNSIFTPRSFPTSEQFTFHSVECKQVEDLINAMPSNKAPGIDKVPTRVIKDCLRIILPFVTSIINASLSSSTFPGIWKTAEITPIPKQGNHELPNNNRPISLLPLLSKSVRESLIISLSPIWQQRRGWRQNKTEAKNGTLLIYHYFAQLMHFLKE